MITGPGWVALAVTAAMAFGPAVAYLIASAVEPVEEPAAGAAPFEEER